VPSPQARSSGGRSSVAPVNSGPILTGSQRASSTNREPGLWERTPGYAPLVVLLAYTGMRIREALGLRWQDVDLDAATIRLRSQLTKDCKRRVPLKTEAGLRDLPILPALRRRLIEHRLASPWTRPGDPVVAATNGKTEAVPQRPPRA
jgi:integrase